MSDPMGMSKTKPFKGTSLGKRPPKNMRCEHCSSVIDWEVVRFASKIFNKTGLEENFLNPWVSG